MEVEWDETKATVNLSQHGISFDEAKTVFIEDELRPEYDLRSPSVGVGDGGVDVGDPDEGDRGRPYFGSPAVYRPGEGR